MLKNIFKLFALLLFFISSANALQEAKIETIMTSKIEKGVSILKQKELSTEKKGEEIIALLDEVFDYNLMSRLSLGKTWKTLSSEQRNEFVEVFTKRLKDSYISKLDLYSDQEVKVLGLEKTKKTRAILNSEILGEDTSYAIKYKFYKKKKVDNWLIYDVDIVGVSIIQTYRNQFSDFLKEKSFDDLIKELNQTK